MTFERELTLEDLLVDPVIGLVMSRDGCTAEDIRHLMRIAGDRVDGTRNHASKPMPRDFGVNAGTRLPLSAAGPQLKASSCGLVRNVARPVQHQMEPAGRLGDGCS